MRISLPELLLIALLTVHGLGSARADQCGSVVEKSQTLDERGASSFPMRKFQKKLRKSRRGVKEWLNAAQENIEAIIDEEEKNKEGSYPSCLYQNSCPSVTKTAQYWQVTGKKCWNVEPITWITCETEEPKSGCRSEIDDDNFEPIGYSCRERYTNMQIWVYCSDKTGIQIMTIGVPTACIAVKNKC